MLSAYKTIFVNLIFAGSYFFSSYLANMLAFPPSNASPIWPGAGIALAGLLIYGKRIMPGLVFGIVCAQIISIGTSGFPETIYSFIALVCFLSLGSLTQALLGAFLIEKFLPQNDSLIRDRSIIRFLLLGGPVSCLLAPTFSSTGLLFFNQISLETLPVNWAVRWAGDTIGVLIFAPLTLTFFADPDDVWHKRRTVLSYPLLVLLTLAAFIFKYARQQEITQITADFDKQSGILHAALSNEIQNQAVISQILKSFFDSTVSVTVEEFYLFSKPLIERKKFNITLEWVPRTFSMQSDQPFDETFPFSIFKKKQPALSCNELFPITFQQPTYKQKNAVGLDVCRAPGDLNAIQIARDSGATSITGLHKHFKNSYRYGKIAFYSPVYQNSQNYTTTTAKRKNLTGFAAVIVNLNDLVDVTLQQLPGIQLLFTITNANELLYSNLQPTSPAFLNETKLNNQATIKIADQNWLVKYYPSSEFIASHQTWNIWWLVFGGVLFTGMTGAGLLMLSGRTLRTEELVRKRTRDLRLSNRKLADNEAQFRELVQAQSAIVWRAQAEPFKFTFVSDEAEKILGFPVQNWLQDDQFWIKQIHPQDRQWAPAFCLENIKRHQSHAFEYRMITKDNNTVWVRDVTNVIIESGKIKELVGFMLDITEQKQAQNKLILSELKYRTLFENDMDALVILDARNAKFIDANTKALDLYEIDIHRLKQLGPLDLSPEFQPNGHPSDEMAEKFIKDALNGNPTSFEWMHTTATGKDILCRVSLIQMPSLGGTFVKGSIRNITEQKQMEDQIRLAATTFETHEGILITDRESNILRVNKAFTDITGYSAAEVIGKNPRILKSGQHDQQFYQQLWQQLLKNGKYEGEIWNRRKNGEIFPEWQTITAVKNQLDEITHYVAIFSDITEKKKHENEIYELAFYDALTALPNRRLFLNQLNKEINIAQRQQRYGAIIFLDLDRFKVLNDSMGHHVGDKLLIQVASRIKQTIRKADTPARLSGDEFVIMLHADSKTVESAKQNAELVAEKVKTTLNQPFLFKNYEHHCSASIGVTLFPDNQMNSNEILQEADKAMYRSKAVGRNSISFYHQSMKQAADARLFLEKELRNAISNQNFVLYYQPQIQYPDKLISAEALIRWNHAEKGIISPAQFIPVAEETGLIIPLGEWVLNEACRQMREWIDQKTGISHVSVNVSSKQFRQENLIDNIKQALTQFQIEAHHLLIELTEGIVIDDIEDTVTKMHALKQIGVKISIDDFGTGYSSLTYLKRLPLNQLKIDRSFIRDVYSDNNDATIVETIIAMAHNLNLDVIAEGVEKPEQLNFLAAKGCHLYQGYYFSPPLPGHKFKHWSLQPPKKV